MTPEELTEEIQKRLDMASEAVRMGQAAAVSTVAKVKAPGHQISGKGTNFRFVSNAGPDVAKATMKKAQESASVAMKKVLND